MGLKSTSMDSPGTEDLAGRVASEIRKLILHWEFLPGTRMLEEDLSKQFGTSRVPIREAFRILEAGGLLEKERNKGYRVRKMGIRDSFDLYDLRLALEMHVCEQLAGRDIAGETLDAWRQLWCSEPSGPDADAQHFADKDRRFHEALALEYGNKALLKQLVDINDQIAFLRLVDFENQGTIDQSRRDHLAIVQAIADRNPPQARESVRENILYAQANVRHGFTEMLARSYGDGETLTVSGGDKEA